MFISYVVYGVLFAFLLRIYSLFYKNVSKFEKVERNHYLFLLATLSLWIFTNALTDLVHDKTIAEIAARSAIFFPLLVMYSIYLISNFFPQTIENQTQKKFINKSITLLVIFFTSLSIFFFNTDLNVSNIKIFDDKPTDFEPGLFYYVIILFSFTVLIFTILNWNLRKKYFTNIQIQQISYLTRLLIAFIITASLGFGVLPIYGLSQYTPLTFLSVILLLYVIQENFLSKTTTINLRSQINKGFIALGISILLFLYFNFIESFNFELNRVEEYLQILLVTGISIIIYSVVQSRFDSDPFENLSLKLIKKMSKTLDEKKLISIIQNSITQSIEVKKVEAISKNNLTNLIKVPEQTLKICFEHLVITPEVVVEDYLRMSNDNIHKEDVKKIYNFFVEEQIQLLLVVKKEQEIRYVFTAKNPKRPIDKGLIRYLQSTSINASISLSRIDLYNQVKDLVDNLELKVKKATQEVEKQKDIIQQKYQEEKDMLGIMGHELRTPMTVARSMQESVIKKLKKGEGDTEYFTHKAEKVYDSILKESDLISTMLEASHIDNKKFNIQIQPTDLVDLIKYAYDVFKKDAKKKQLEINLDVDKDSIPTVNTDSGKMQQIFNNIISNAVKYTEKGFVHVELKRENDWIRFTVKDSGIGIPEEALKKLGSKFFRVNQYLNEQKNIVRAGGTGLGLYVVKGLIDVLNCKLDVKSKVGEGSNFTVYIPVKSDFDANVLGLESEGGNDLDQSSINTDASDMFTRLGLNKKKEKKTFAPESSHKKEDV